MGRGKLKEALIHKWLAFIIVMLVSAVLFIYVNCFVAEEELSYSTSVFVSGRVVQMLQDNTAADETTENVLRGSQDVIVEVTGNGPFKGKQYMVTNYLSALYQINAQVGTKVLLRLDPRESGGYSPYIYSYDRADVIYGCLILFAALLCAVGGRKGVMALFSLAFSLVCIWKLMFPMMLYGFPVLAAAVIVVVLTTLATFILIDGVNTKTVCGAAGTIAGVAVAAVFAVVVGSLTHITGFQTTEAEALLLTASDHGMKIKNLFTAGILIAALGAVMDVAMSIASAIHELREVNPSMNAGELFRSGMNIGRDAMGTMANTLILAFVGSSLTLILLISTYDIPFIQLVNTDLVAREVIQGIAGSLGVVLTVPIVALLSSAVESRRHADASEECQVKQAGSGAGLAGKRRQNTAHSKAKNGVTNKHKIK